MSFDFIQLPCKHWRNEDDCFSWRLLVFTINGSKKPSMTVGRHSACDFKLNPPEYPYFVSRKHAKFEVKEDKLFVEDLGSKNGTYINNVMLSPFTEYPLQNTDLIAFGCMSEEKPYPGKHVNQEYTPFLFRVIKAKDAKKEISLQWETNHSKSVNKDDETNEALHTTLANAQRKAVGNYESDSGIDRRNSCSSNNSAKSSSSYMNICSNIAPSSSSSMQGDGTGEFLAKTSDNSHHKTSSADCKETCSLPYPKQNNFSAKHQVLSNKRKLSLVKSTRKKIKTGFSRAVKEVSTSPEDQNCEDLSENSVEECASFECKIESADRDDVVTWVQCDACDKWFHTVCVGCEYDRVKHRTQQFHCGFCSITEST